MTTNMTTNMTRSLKSISLTSFLFIAALTLTACGTDNQTADARGDVVSGTLVATHSSEDINALFTGSGLFADKTAVYDVAAYKIVYKTVDTSGNIIDASGLLTIPQKAADAKSPLLSYQHGTKFLDADVPSNNYGVRAEAVVAASFGYVASAPDYIGYGASRGMIHPHGHAESLATATIDMLRASKHFLSKHDIATNGQLFLGGHSEGGYATIATEKMMQEQYADEFNVTAATAGAGAYDRSHTVAAMLQSATMPQPATVGFDVKSYDTVYGLNRIDDFIQAPYVDVINTYYDGSKSKDEINSHLTFNTAELFNAKFLADFNGDGETALKQLIAQNDIYDWAPAVPTRLFHGKDDVNAPFFNSVTAVNGMKANGAPDVELVVCQETPANHQTCRFPYFVYSLDFFAQYASDL
jgi:pimeloyl-ACP methyl ester carboxylesterase